MKIDEIDVYGLKVSFRPHSEDEKVLEHSFDFDIFYKEIPYFKISPDPVFIDVGAHIGTFSLLSAKKYPASKVYSFEASRDSFQLLSKNQSDNDLQNLFVFNKALMGEDGFVKLYHSQENGNWGHSVTKELSNSFEEIEAISLDRFINETHIEKIDLIKFNCEGAEFDILTKLKKESIIKIRLGIILYHEDLVDDNYSLFNLQQVFIKNNFHIVHTPQGPQRGWLIVLNKKHYSIFYILKNRIMSKLKRLIS